MDLLLTKDNKNTSSSFLDIIYPQAYEFIKKERERFSKVYDAIIEYCKGKKVMITDPLRMIAFLRRKESGISEKYKTEQELMKTVIEIYCENPYDHAMSLANLIFEKVGKFVAMKTILTYEEFVVFYDTREVANLKNISINRKIESTFELINPININNVFYFPPELEIIDIYHKLYSPDQCESWKHQLILADEIYSNIKSKLKDIFSTCISTVETVECKNKEGGDIAKKDRSLTDLKKIFVNEFLRDSNYILIGIWADIFLDICGESKSDNRIFDIEPMQIISSNSITKDFENINFFMSRYTRFELLKREHDIVIPNDFRISKTMFSFNIPNKKGEISKKAFLEVYNCCQFELIPTKSYFRDKHVYQIGNLFVLLRFLFIDIWFLRILTVMKTLEDSIVDRKFRKVLLFIEKVYENEELWDGIFGLDYKGAYIDYRTSKKLKEAKEKKKIKHRIYYPVLGMKSLANEH
jgi:hypothetical protein